MRHALIAALLCFGLAGCAHHYYRINDTRVDLYLRAPDARFVSFACSLDSFTLRPAEKIDGRTWKISVPAGKEFSYFYIVDGRIMVPDCVYCEKDDFGSENCIYVPEM